MANDPLLSSGRTPLRDRLARLSSRGRTLLAGGVILASVAGTAATLTLQAPERPAQPESPAPLAAPGPDPALAAERDALWPVIQQWKRLRGNDRLPFESYADFLIAHRGWPGEAAMRRVAERQIVPDQTNPERVIALFAVAPPLSNAGKVRHAEALATLGNAGAARAAAGVAWIAGALATEDEGRMILKFGPQFTPAEQDQRMERLLWDRSTGSAQRQLDRASSARRPIYAARLAFQTKAADAGDVAAQAGADAERDAGFQLDRAAWLRDTGQSAAARAYLAQAPLPVAPPYDPAKYLDGLLQIAKGAATDNQTSFATGIADRGEAAYAPGTDISQRPLSERDPYTSLVWLGGQAAMKGQKPADAVRFFARYAAASQTPGSQAKGAYWAGRAAQAAGDQPGAQGRFQQAALQVDQYYGQLATERLGRALAVPADPARVAVADGVRAGFERSELVRAARLLGQHRDWIDQTQFVRTIAQGARTDVDHVLADELAAAIKRPDLAVMVSRQARSSGARDPIRTGFPTVPVPAAMETHWTMIHALTRQESQFDVQAMSQVGARGLMQLMPPTAREQAGKLGLPYATERLTEDPGYNVTLGSSFFDRMLTYYKGNYVLAVASYNAGPGNVNRFIRDNGDPRLPGVDVVDWVEAIPFTETRAYVQKVLENAVVYDLFNPARAKAPAANRLSWYLGKQSAG